MEQPTDSQAELPGSQEESKPPAKDTSKKRKYDPEEPDGTRTKNARNRFKALAMACLRLLGYPHWGPPMSNKQKDKLTLSVAERYLIFKQQNKEALDEQDDIIKEFRKLKFLDSLLDSAQHGDLSVPTVPSNIPDAAVATPVIVPDADLLQEIEAHIGTSLKEYPRVHGADSEMTLIPRPPVIQGVRAIQILEHIRDFFTDKENKKRIKTWKESWTDYFESTLGARFLHGNRCEVFFRDQQNPTRPSAAMCWLIKSAMYYGEQNTLESEEDVLDIVKIVEQYAVNRAACDPRIHDWKYEFANFAILFSDGHSPRQDVHFDDIVYRNMQFALAVCNNQPWTNEYKTTVSVKSLPADFQKLWPNEEVPKEIIDGIMKCDSLQKLLTSFGALLGPTQVVGYSGKKKPRKTAVGDIACMPASIPHCGPKSTGFRAIIFFTGHPLVVGEQYPAKQQYCSATVYHDHMLELWPDLSAVGRRWLLQHMASALKEDKNSISNMVNKHIIKMAKELQNCLAERAKMQALIENLANMRGVFDGPMGRKNWLDESLVWDIQQTHTK